MNKYKEQEKEREEKREKRNFIEIIIFCSYKNKLHCGYIYFNIHNIITLNQQEQD